MKINFKIWRQSFTLYLLFVLIAVCVGCSKKPGGSSASNPIVTPTPTPPSPPSLTAYQFDILFGGNAYCNIQTETSNQPSTDLITWFTLGGKYESATNDMIPPLNILVQQGLHRPTTTYYNPVLYVYEGTLANSFTLVTVPANYNFFTLPYNNGPAPFSGNCQIIEGKGKYKNIARTGLTFSGFADTINHTGNIRLTGSISF